MTKLFKNRNLQLAAVICLPLILIHYTGIADLGYFVFVPILTLAVLTLSALASPADGGNANG